VRPNVVRRTALRLPFLLAVAILAAALGDPLVETIANSGIFGGGYADNNHTSVIPALVAGTALALEVTLLRALAASGLLGRGQRDRIVELAGRACPSSFARDVPWVIALQLAALFLMESIEQLAFGGKLRGGTLWLGGPVAFGLCAHALVGAGALALVGRLARMLLRAFCSLITIARDFILIAQARATADVFRRRRREPASPIARAPHARHAAGRAPPPLPTPA
jgi:hypothetical protein